MSGPLITTEFGLAHAPVEGDIPKALCHPIAPMFADGLCETCFEVREKALDAAVSRDMIHGKAAVRRILRELHQHAEYVKGLGRAAQAIVEHHLPEYAELHIKAARVAAEDGNSKPAEWALTNIRPAGGPPVIEPPAAKAGPGGTGGKSGVTVMIGVNMGGVPKEAVDTRVVVVTPMEVEGG